MHLTAFLLQQHEPVPFDAIRETFPAYYTGSNAAVDKKWTRDKNALVAAGVPILFVEGPDNDPGYVIDPRAYFLDKLNLEPVEAALLATAAGAALRVRDNPAREDLISALRTITAALRPNQQSLAFPSNGRQDSGAGDRRAQPRKAGALLRQIRDAIHARRRVRLRYMNAKLEESDREVDLYGYAWRRGVWLVVGYCHTKNDVRVFYVDRIKALVWANPKAKGPDYVIPSDFDIRVHSHQQPWEYYAHPALDATVRLRGSLSPIASNLFPRANTQHVAGDGAVTLAVRTTDLGALVRHVLYLGPDCELVGPEEGRARAREMLAKARAHAASLATMASSSEVSR